MTVLTFPAHKAQTLRQQVTENIRVMMTLRQIHQSQIMALLGLSQPSVSRRLSGQQAWNVDELEVIAAAFEVSVSKLVGDTPEHPTSPTSRPDSNTVEYSLQLVA